MILKSGCGLKFRHIKQRIFHSYKGIKNLISAQFLFNSITLNER